RAPRRRSPAARERRTVIERSEAAARAGEARVPVPLESGVSSGAREFVGQPIKRLEDRRLLLGQGRFIDDLVLPRMLHLAFVRSPHAHAAVRAVDDAAARATPGVVAVLCARDIAGVAQSLTPRLEGPGFTATEWPLLAGDAVRFVGEAVAAVIGESRAAASDGREAVRVDYDPRPAVATLDAALAGGDVLIRRSNARGAVDEAFAGAAVVLRETFTHGRLAASPM